MKHLFRRHLPELGLAAASLIAIATIVYLTRRYTFHNDEWTFLLDRPRSVLDLFRPHNEHWSTGLYLIYEALIRAFGLRSYLPYIAALALVHVITALGLYILVSPRAGRWAALALALLLLFLGRGAEDLFWAWQLGFVGSCAFGIWALVALDRHGNPVLAAVLLTGSLGMQGVGLFFVAAAAGYLVAAGRRRDLLWLLIPIGAYFGWVLTFGQTAMANDGRQLTLAFVVSVATYVVNGVAASAGAVAGFPVIGPIAGLAAVLIVARRPTLTPLIVAGAAGLLAEFLVIGLVRTQLGLYDSSRYVYPAAIFIIMSGGIALVSLTGPRGRLLAAFIIGLAIILNTAVLVRGWPGRDQLSTDFGCITATEVMMPTGLGTVPPEVRCSP